MLRWKPTFTPPAQPRWQSREQILKAHLDSLSPDELLLVRPDYYWLRFGSRALNRDAALKANFNPDQPRVPAGNRDGGQWTSEGVSGTPHADPTRQILDDIYAARRRLPGDRPLLPVPHLSPPRDTGAPREPVRIVNNAQTGMSTVDEATEKLRVVLENTVNARPQGFGADYGRQVHYAFGDAVRAANIRGIAPEDVETTFPKDTRYGSKDSIRTDIVLRNEGGDVIAIYDVKTGNATLDAGRVQELRDKTEVNFRVPIIEMHVTRGLSLKGSSTQARYFWIITLRLWNPWIRDIRGRRAA